MLYYRAHAVGQSLARKHCARIRTPGACAALGKVGECPLVPRHILNVGSDGVFEGKFAGSSGNFN